MQESRPTLEGLEQVLDLIASDPRIPPNYADWIRATIRSCGWKNRILTYILDHAPSKAVQPSLLDVGAQFGSLAVYAAKLGCRAAALDYAPYTKIYREIAADHGVDYRECDVGSERLPFPDAVFDFVTYTDVLEHHAFSSKRVLQEIHRILVPGGRLILMTPNHASIYNRIKLVFGHSVNDDFDYFFDTCAAEEVYDGHHREYTRAEVKAALQRTQFRVVECRIVEQDLAPLLRYLRRYRTRSEVPSQYRDVLLCALGKIWTPLHLPFGRWIWAVGEKDKV
jgi:SAM-dependent methyltransferase